MRLFYNIPILCLLAVFSVVHAEEYACLAKRAMWNAAADDAQVVFHEDGIAVTYGEARELGLAPLDIRTGVQYVLSVKYRGTEGTSAFFYIENNTEGDWQNVGRNVTGNGKVETALVPFVFERRVGSPSYANFRLGGKGTFEILSFELVAMEGSLKEKFLNADFANGAFGWDLGENSAIVDGRLEQFCAAPGEMARTVSAPVKVDELQNYRLSFQVQGIEGYGDEALTHYFRVYPLDNRGTAIVGTDKWLDCMGNQQVKRLDFRVPSRHEELRFVVETKGPARTRFANFTLERVDEKPVAAELLLDMPYNYRDGVFASNPSSMITGRVVVGSADVASFTLDLKDASGKPLWRATSRGAEPDADARLIADDNRFSVPAPPAGQTSTLTLTARDAAGNALLTEEKTLHNYPANRVEITFRDDGVTLVNGQPFFQIGHWWYTNRGDVDEDLEFLKEAGFNVILMPNESPDRFPILKKVADHGLFGVIELPHVIAGDTPEAKKAFYDHWAALIKEYQTHPALFGYFGPDEAMWGGMQAETMREAYHLARDNDPYHPLWYNEAPCGEVPGLREYAKDTCDVYGIDIYPVGAPHGSLVEDRGLTAVGKHTDRSMQAVDGQKPVWMILQGFGWAHIRAETHNRKPEEVEGLVYPDFHQSRFMAFNSILHGATGIQYHYLGYSVWLPDEFWKAIRQVTLELKYLTPVLTARRADDSRFACDDKRINFMVKRLDGRNYYLIANESPEPVDARFTGCPESSLSTLFEDGRTAVENGGFSLHFEPYDVKVMADFDFAPADVVYQATTYRPYSAPLKDDVRK